MSRYAKASSAGSTPGADRNRAQTGIAFTCLLALLAFAGSGASSALAAVPPKGVTGFFGSEGVYAGQMRSPQGAAVNQSTGATYVADSENNRVVVFDSNGEFQRAFGSDVVAYGPGDASGGFEICVPANGDSCTAGSSGGVAGGLSAPQGVAVNQTSGDVYVSDGSNLRVQQFSSQGSFIRAFGRGVVAKGPGNQPGGAEVQQVTVKATSGAFRLKFGSATTGPIAFNTPASGAGSVEAALNELSTIGGEGGSVAVTGGPGDATGSSPYVVTFGGSLSGDNVDQITIDTVGLGMPTGTLLTCSSSTSATTTSFQWLRNGAPIASATSSTYTTVAADEGKAVQCLVGKYNGPTANNTQGTGAVQATTLVLASPATATAPSTVLAEIPSPVLQGSAKVGEPAAGGFTCERGQWSGEPSFSYQWYRNGLALSGNGADTNEYLLQTADAVARATFQCAVTATTAGGSVTSVSKGAATSPAPTPAAPGGNASAPGAVLTYSGSTATTTTPGASVFEICTAGDTCKAGISGSAGGEFKFSFSGQVTVAPAGSPNAGNVLVTDPANRRVQEFTAVGDFVRAFGFDIEAGGVTTFEVCTVITACKEGAAAGSGAGQFANNTPTGIAEDAAGNIYTDEPTTNFRVQKFTLPGNVVTPQGTFAEADLKGTTVESAPTAVAVDPTSGNLLTVKGFAAAATPSCPITGTASVAEKRVVEVSSGGTLEGAHGVCAGIGTANGIAVRGFNGNAYLSSVSPASSVYVLNAGQPQAPKAQITNVSGIGSTEATLNGLINPEGPELPYGLQTTYQIEYKRSAVSTFTPLSGTEATAGNRTTTQAITALVAGLQPNTSYDVRLVAKKGFGSGSASQTVSFTTDSAPPTVALPETASLNATEALLHGAVNPNNEPTGWRFEYIDDAAHQQSGFSGATKTPAESQSAGSGGKAVAVARTIAGLSPGTTYHYRLIAANPSGQSVATGQFEVPESPSACPNASIRADQVSSAWTEGSSFLPACMGVEMASPPVKYNQHAEVPSFSISDDRLKFGSVAALADTVKQAGVLDDYVSTRTATGWVIKPTTPSGSYAQGSGAAGGPCGYALDFSRWSGWGSTESQVQLAVTTPFENNLAGDFQPLGPTLVPTSDSTAVGTNVIQSSAACYGGSADAKHIFFGLKELAYIPGDPVPTSVALANVYEAYRAPDGTPTVKLLQRDRFGRSWGGRCGAEVGGAQSTRGSISADASIVYFTTRPTQVEGTGCQTLGGGQFLNKQRILRRVSTVSGPEITEVSVSECTRVSPPCDASDGDDKFQGANQESDLVFFTTTRQLANSDLDRTNDLYLYDANRPAGSRLTQVSAGDPTNLAQGNGAEVQGVSDFAGDGSRVYFVAKGKLTAHQNQFGDIAQPGNFNLYMYQRDDAHPGGLVAFVGTLESSDTSTWVGAGVNAKGTATAVPLLGPGPTDQSVGGDGHIVVFATKAPLSPDDTDGGKLDVYRYDSLTGAIERVTRAAPGGTDNGNVDMRLSISAARGFGAKWPNEISARRWVSEDGRTILFLSSEALDPEHSDGGINVYVWRHGVQTAITATNSVLPVGDNAVLSLSGESIAFTSSSRLLPQDGDAVRDVYVARADGGSPIVPPPALCAGEACQGAPGTPPATPGTATESFQGAGNVVPKHAKKQKKKKKSKHRKRHRTNSKHAANGTQGGRK